MNENLIKMENFNQVDINPNKEINEELSRIE